MKIAKLFQNGQSQAVRLPKEFRFKGKSVFIKKVSSAVILLPIRNPWKPLYESLNKFSDDFMTIREQPEIQKREDFE